MHTRLFSPYYINDYYLTEIKVRKLIDYIVLRLWKDLDISGILDLLNIIFICSCVNVEQNKQKYERKTCIVNASKLIHLVVKGELHRWSIRQNNGSIDGLLYLPNPISTQSEVDQVNGRARKEFKNDIYQGR